jgi:ABC-type phosphate transport system permease subunit
MTDLPVQTPSAYLASDSYTAHIRTRRRSELWLRGFGLGAIAIALLMLAILLTSIIYSAVGAFRQTHVTIEVPCFVISFPLGIGAAIYLEEFAPKNRVSDFIEVNINNLAAVPSVVFGLLALAVFINWFGLPRRRRSSAA